MADTETTSNTTPPGAVPMAGANPLAPSPLAPTPAQIAQVQQHTISLVRNAAQMQPLNMGQRNLFVRLAQSEEGFVGRYLRHFSSITQVPLEFHVANAISAVAAAVGNRVWGEAWQRPFYANLYLLLIARSGVLRKSYAMSLMKDLLTEAAADIILPTSFSSESLEVILEKRPSGLLIYSEFGHLLKRLGRDYMGGVKELLTDLFDNPQRLQFQYRGRAGAIVNPAPTVLGASNLEWLEGNLRESDLGGGFLTRFLIWTGDDAGPPVSSQTSPDKAARAVLVDNLKQLAQVEGEADFSAIRDLVDDIIQRYGDAAKARGIDPNLIGMYSRIGINMFKLATIFMLSRTLGVKRDAAGNVVGKDLQVIDRDVLRAAATLRYCHAEMEALPMAFSDWERELRKVEGWIKERPGITTRELIQKTRLRTGKLSPIIQTLTAMGSIDERPDKAGGWTRSTYWPK